MANHAPTNSGGGSLAFAGTTTTSTSFGYSFTFLFGANDQDGDPLSVVSVKPTGSAGAASTIAPSGSAAVTGTYGTLTLNSNGTFTYAQNLATLAGVAGHADDKFDFTVSDGHGGTATSTFDFYIDRAPVAVNDTATTVAGAVSKDVAHGVLVNDSDPDGDNFLTVTQLNGQDLQTPYETIDEFSNPITVYPGDPRYPYPPSQPTATVHGAYGDLTLNADGSYSYAVTNAPASGGAHDVFTYTMRDQWDFPATRGSAQIDIVVPSSNHAPTGFGASSLAIAGATTTSTSFGYTFTFLFGAHDQDNDPLSVISVKPTGSAGAASSIAPSGSASVTGTYGTLVLNSDGTYSYAQDLSKLTGVTGHAEDKFDYTVSDGHGGTATTTFDFYIDRTPVAVSDTATIVAGALSKDAAHGVLSNDSDPDGDNFLTVTQLNGQTLAAPIQPPFETVDAFGNPITIYPGDPAYPYPPSQPTATVHGTYGDLTLNADGSYSYAVTNAATAGTHDIFTYTMRDQWDVPGTSATAQIDIVVPSTNHAPTSTNLETLAIAGTATTSTSFGYTFTFLFGAHDPDHDPLSVVSVKPTGSAGTASTIAPSGSTSVTGTYGTLTLNSDGTYSYAQDLSTLAGTTGHADDKFDFTLSDGHGGAATATFDFIIDRAPVAINDTATVVAGQVSKDAAHGVLSNDTDPDGDNQFFAVKQINGQDLIELPPPVAIDLGLPLMPSLSVVGTYGNLRLNFDGSYSYVVTHAPTSAGAHDIFTYTMYDRWDVPGTRASAQIDITVSGPISTGLAGLAAGSAAGTAIATIAGVAAPGASIQVLDGSVLVASATADPVSGAFSLVTPDLGAGEHTLSAAGQVFVVEVMSAASVVAALGTLQANPGLTAIWLTDSHRLPVASTSAMSAIIANDQSALDKIAGGYSFAITTTTATSLRVVNYDASGHLVSTIVDTYKAGVLSSEKTTFADGTTDTKLYTAGTLTSETMVHADGSKDVYLSNITGRSYVAEHDSYNAAGVLTNAIRTTDAGSTDYMFNLAADGTRTTDQYDATGLLKSHTVVHADGSSDILTYTGGVLVREVVKYAAGAPDISDTKTYTAGVLTNETIVHADNSKDVYLSNIIGKSYNAEHDTYNAAGVLTHTVRTQPDGSTDYTFDLAADGTKTTDQYDATGPIKSHSIVHADGSSDIFTYTSGVLVREVVKYAAGAPDISDTKTYTAGVLTNETIVHADNSKDVLLSNIIGKNYVAEHDTYNAAGVLTHTVRTQPDGQTDYTFDLAADGTKTTDQYDATGLFKSHSVVHADGSSDILTYTGGVLAREVVKYAAGAPDISDTKTYTSGVLSNETVLHADNSKDVYLSNIVGKSYVAEHDTYNSAGALTSIDRTQADGSHQQTALTSNVSLLSTAGVTDVMKSSSFGSDTFVFSPGSGNDQVTQFHAGDAANHDVLEIHGQGAVSDFSSWAGAHLHQLPATADTIVDVSATDHVTLKGVSLASLTASDFHFV